MRKGTRVMHITSCRRGTVDYIDGTSFSIPIVAWTDDKGNKCGNTYSELQIKREVEK